jgi:hypothetical protein
MSLIELLLHRAPDLAAELEDGEAHLQRKQKELEAKIREFETQLRQLKASRNNAGLIQQRLSQFLAAPSAVCLICFLRDGFEAPLDEIGTDDDGNTVYRCPTPGCHDEFPVSR